MVEPLRTRAQQHFTWCYYFWNLFNFSNQWIKNRALNFFYQMKLEEMEHSFNQTKAIKKVIKKRGPNPFRFAIFASNGGWNDVSSNCIIPLNYSSGHFLQFIATHMMSKATTIETDYSNQKTPYQCLVMLLTQHPHPPTGSITKSYFNSVQNMHRNTSAMNLCSKTNHKTAKSLVASPINAILGLKPPPPPGSPNVRTTTTTTKTNTKINHIYLFNNIQLQTKHKSRYLGELPWLAPPW